MGQFDGNVFKSFIDTLKLGVPSGTLPSNDPALGTAISAVTAAAEHNVINPSPGSTSPVSANSGLSNNQIGNANQVQLFDSTAAATINAFLKANPNADIILDHGNVIIYDGHTELDQSQALTVQIWESSPTGPAIALVGHADHGPTV